MIFENLFLGLLFRSSPPRTATDMLAMHFLTNPKIIPPLQDGIPVYIRTDIDM